MSCAESNTISFIPVREWLMAMMEHPDGSDGFSAEDILCPDLYLCLKEVGWIMFWSLSEQSAESNNAACRAVCDIVA
ncbi:hypothetical protein V6N13_031518 [Hibiscus sabdariffa]|uniref:Uncharacterized protein n=2 Tax=Hibiscus sabdariffa TaxID=183260 RepID=A0ABR1ZJ18_9ROSI